MTWAHLEGAIVAGYNFQWMVCAIGFSLIMAAMAFQATTRDGRLLAVGVGMTELATGVHRLFWFLAALLGPGLEGGVSTESPYHAWFTENRWLMLFVVQACVIGYMLAAHRLLERHLGRRWWTVSYGASVAMFACGAALSTL